MLLEMDNKGQVHFANNWSASEWIRHINVTQNFLHELKKEGLIQMEHVTCEDNNSDLFTKMYKCTLELVSKVNKKKD